MITRTIVSLERERLETLKGEAHALGISLAELIRRIVARHQESSPSPGQPTDSAYSRLVAIGSSGHDDVGDRHDALLGDALARDHAT